MANSNFSTKSFISIKLAVRSSRLAHGDVASWGSLLFGKRETPLISWKLFPAPDFVLWKLCKYMMSTIEKFLYETVRDGSITVLLNFKICTAALQSVQLFMQFETHWRTHSRKHITDEEGNRRVLLSPQQSKCLKQKHRDTRILVKFIPTNI